MAAVVSRSPVLFQIKIILGIQHFLFSLNKDSDLMIK